MRILTCIKRVPSPGAKISLTDDGTAVDTRHLGFTISPHEECAVEEAVQLAAAHGGSSTVLTLGPPEADEQLRNAIAMGVDHAVLLPIEPDADGVADWEPRATARAIAAAITALESEEGGFDLLLFGNESADAGNYQVGVRVAHALGRPVLDGIKDVEVADGAVRVRRSAADGFTVHQLPLPAVLAVREGINLPRYPAMRGRLLAKKATIRELNPTPMPGGLQRLRLRTPQVERTETVILGSGADAASAAADVLEEVGLL
ncbi:MAG: electron transfer flavoprotein subunit beta/FixA family protein [Actinomycetota bacterium]